MQLREKSSIRGKRKEASNCFSLSLSSSTNGRYLHNIHLEDAQERACLIFFFFFSPAPQRGVLSQVFRFWQFYEEFIKLVSKCLYNGMLRVSDLDSRRKEKRDNTSFFLPRSSFSPSQSFSFTPQEHVCINKSFD